MYLLQGVPDELYMCMKKSDGSFEWVLIRTGVIAGSQTFTESGTFTVPAGVYHIRVSCWGAGGRGGFTNGVNESAGGGGGGGAYGQQDIDVVPEVTYSVTVGTTYEAASSFDVFVTAGGGLNGGDAVYMQSGAGGAGGTSTATINVPGSAGQNGDWAYYLGGDGGAGGLGGSGGSGATETTPSSSGVFPGGGGGGGVSNENPSGSAGASGKVIVTWGDV
jgi:hypothetical protein